MLSNTLNTNEIKNSVGTEVEYQRLSTDGRKTEFALITEAPSLPKRLNISHIETGSGINKRRRSVIRFDDTSMSDVDTTVPVTDSAYIVADTAIGAHSTTAPLITVLAKLQSFVSTTGAGTTVLFDGSGNGAQVLVTGGL